ncbi:hypothetical protein C8R46DRAFT_1287259 [Mycena filopes]|nr:hypothetical protein C8R46DRAFT_1287259 [Mycena filopes]
MSFSRHASKRDAQGVQPPPTFPLSSSLFNSPFTRILPPSRPNSPLAPSANPYAFQMLASPRAAAFRNSPGSRRVVSAPPFYSPTTNLSFPPPITPRASVDPSANPYAFLAAEQPLPRPRSAPRTLMPHFETLHVSSTSQNHDNSGFASDISAAASAIAFPKPGKARRPRQGEVHRPSALRPLVPARLRSLAWQTPHGIAAMGSRRYLPPKDLAMVKASICRALAPSSQSNYGAGPLRFTQYCDKNEIPENLRMPAEPLLLCCFLVDSIGSSGLKCAQNWLNGISYWHTLNDAPWHGNDTSVKKILRTISKDYEHTRPLRGSLEFTARRNPGTHPYYLRGPISVEHMRCIRTNLDLASPRGAAFWALACAAFWGCRRLGELTLPSSLGFDRIYHASRSSHLARSRAGGLDVVSIHLPWTKTTGRKGGSLILTATNDDLCPVWAVENHLRINHSPDADTPLFAFRDGAKWTPVVKTHFMALIANLFRAAKLDQVFGHSFRIGGSAFLLCCGVEPEVVMKIGGWTSTCFLIYWRKLESVMLVALARAWSKHKAAFMAQHSLVDEDDLEIEFVRLH